MLRQAPLAIRTVGEQEAASSTDSPTPGPAIGSGFFLGGGEKTISSFQKLTFGVPESMRVWLPFQRSKSTRREKGQHGCPLFLDDYAVRDGGSEPVCNAHDQHDYRSFSHLSS